VSVCICYRQTALHTPQKSHILPQKSPILPQKSSTILLMKRRARMLVVQHTVTQSHTHTHTHIHTLTHTHAHTHTHMCGSQRRSNKGRRAKRINFTESFERVRILSISRVYFRHCIRGRDTQSCPHRHRDTRRRCGTVQWWGGQGGAWEGCIDGSDLHCALQICCG